MKDKLIVGKIGGAVIDDDALLSAVLDSFCALPGQLILVHGGGVMASSLAAQLGVPQEMHEGRRVTTAQTLDIAKMIYAGKINTELVSELAKRNRLGLGINGADAGIIQSVRRPKEPVDFGWVGDIKEVSGERLSRLLQSSLVPVFSAITSNLCGDLFNTNADTQASEIALALVHRYEVELRYCFDFDGVREDLHDPLSMIRTLDRAKYEDMLKSGAVSGGMKPKLDNAFRALENGVSRVILGGKDVFDLSSTNYTTLVL